MRPTTSRTRPIAIPPFRRSTPSAARLAATLAAACLLALAGCYPDHAAWLSADGKFVAHIPMERDNGAGTVRAVDVLTIASGKWQRILLPDQGSAIRVYWLDNRLLVYATHPSKKISAAEDPPAATDDPKPAADPDPAAAPTPTPATLTGKRWWSVDPATAKITATDLPATAEWAARGEHDGKPCLLLADYKTKKQHLHAIADLAHLATRESNTAPVADGWSLVQPDLDKPLTEWCKTITLKKPDTTTACTLDASPLFAQPPTKNTNLIMARMNPDHSRLLLVFGDLDKGKQWQFGLFNTADGALVWQRAENFSEGWFGEPAVLGDTVYNLERAAPDAEKNDHDTFSGALVRYTAKERSVIGSLPTRANDQTGTYTVAPDGKKFVVLVVGEGGNRVLLVPIGETLAAKDCQTFEPGN